MRGDFEASDWCDPSAYFLFCDCSNSKTKKNAYITCQMYLLGWNDDRNWNFE